MENNIVLLSISKNEIQELLRTVIIEEFPKPKKKLLYSSKELCVVLGISLSTLNNWKAAGIVPCKKLGKRIFYDIDDVIKSMEESRHQKILLMSTSND